MVSTLLVSFVMLVSPTVTEVEQLAWMAGDWTCEIWGGTFEESWNDPKGGAMQGMGRHLSDGETSFMEFMSIEQVEGKGLVMFVHNGALSKGARKPAEFVLLSIKDNVATFERDVENDFPKRIVYTAKGDKSIECALTGEEDGREQQAVFNFVLRVPLTGS